MSSKVTFRPATKSDSRKIAELFKISSGGVAEYVWSTLTPEYPGLTPLEIGARRYAREEGAFSYKNCTVAEVGGEVIGMVHAYPIGEKSEQEEEAGEPVDPILEPYAKLEVPGSYYVSGMAVFPEYRGGSLGTRMLEIVREKARQSGCREVSLLVFEQNEGALRLYERNGFAVIDRALAVPHKLIRYTGEVLLMTAPA
jgi:ribosomal protein S18 acetylase RimI-like enzyme